MKTDIKKSSLAENSSSKRTAASHSFLYTLSGSVSDAVIITDKKLIIEYWNKEASRVFGLNESVDDVVQTINATGKLKIKYSNKTTAIKKNLEPEKQLAILRIIQEQFNNILKHADASEATISIEADEHLLSLEIADNGTGFDPSSTKKGLGLNNMFNRVAHYNGLIELISSNGKGCTLQVKIPS